MKATVYKKLNVIIGALVSLAILSIVSVWTFTLVTKQVLSTEGLKEVEQSETELDRVRVRDILVREFEGLFDLDDTWISPAYVLGDLNGDGVKDLAAAAKLARGIDSNPGQQPGFWFGKPIGPGKSKVELQRDRDQLRIDDLNWYRDNKASIVIVIHGARDRGLVQAKPNQKFVLVDGWRIGKLNMTLFHGQLKPSRYGDEREIVPPPKLLANAVVLINQYGLGDAVYWDGAKYRWYGVVESTK